MPDLTAIAQGLTAFKALKELGQAMIEVRDAAAFRDKQIEFQAKIIEAQNALFEMQQERTELVDRVSELEKEITRLKDWETEKCRYRMAEVGRGAIAYLLKPEAAGSDPKHMICPTCFERGTKSVLQALSLVQQRGTHGDLRTCPICKTSVAVARGEWSPTII